MSVTAFEKAGVPGAATPEFGRRVGVFGQWRPSADHSAAARTEPPLIHAPISDIACRGALEVVEGEVSRECVRRREDPVRSVGRRRVVGGETARGYDQPIRSGGDERSGTRQARERIDRQRRRRVQLWPSVDVQTPMGGR